MALTPVDEAIAQITGQAKLLTSTERLPLVDLLGRTLSEDLVSPISVPQANNSAMDGYAVNADDIQIGKPIEVSDRIPAGTVGRTLAPGSAARIFTGAPMPSGANAVVIQENTELQGDKVVLLTTPQSGDNVREAGQDIQAGQIILPQGHRMRAQDIGLAASVGCHELLVFKKLKVGVMSTGDELVDPPTPLAPGQIYNSNHYTLQSLIRSMGMQPVDLGMVADTPEATEAALARGAEQADCILSSGGVSVGEEDHVKAAVEKLGALNLWRLAIKPGKPLAFGHVNNTPFFGLPGNPVSGFVTFMLIARQYLLLCQGATQTSLMAVYGRSNFETRGGSRREYYRVQIEFDGNGESRVENFGNQGSGIMSSVSWANGLAEIDIDQQVNKGDLIKVLLLP